MHRKPLALKRTASASAFQRLYDELEQAQMLIEDLERRQTEADAVIARQRAELDSLAGRHDATLLQLDQVQERLALRESALDRFSKASDRSSTELRASREELRIMDEELRISLKQVGEANAHLAESNEELQRLRAADDAKLRLLASASYDLRQPVMSMGLFLDVLRNRHRRCRAADLGRDSGGASVDPDLAGRHAGHRAARCRGD